MQDVDSKNNGRNNVIHFNFKGGRMINGANSISKALDVRWSCPAELFKTQARRRRRHGGQAKMFRPNDLRNVFSFILAKRSSPEADMIKVCLSVMAGLRACEIAGLRVSDVTNADGSTANFIRIRAEVSKNGRPREIPICP